MTTDRTARVWSVDLASKLATCGNILIRFSQCASQGLTVAFLAGATSCLEEQCMIAGEAVDAIRSELRKA